MKPGWVGWLAGWWLVACADPCPEGLARSDGACVALPGGGDVELGSARIGPDGGRVAGGPFRLEVPAGALDAPRTFTLFAIDPESLPAAVVPGTAVRVEPAGTVFATPARLYVRFAAPFVAGGFDPEGDAVALLDAPAEELAEPRYDADAREASGAVPHLSPFGVWRRDLCLSPRTWCRPRGCVDLASDPGHCGACYAQCAPGASCIGGGCLVTGDAGADAGHDAGPIDASAVDAGHDAGADAGTDAGVDAGLAPCAMGAPGIATHQELFAGAYLNPQVSAEPLGAAMVWGDALLARVDAAGVSRGPVEPLLTGRSVLGMVQVGPALWVLDHGAGTTYVRPVMSDGSVGPAIAVGPGRAVEGGLAYHAPSGQLGVLRTDDATLTAATVDLGTGTVTDYAIGPDPDFLVVPSIAAQDGPGGSRFTVVYGSAAAPGYTARYRTIAPLGAVVDLSAPGAVERAALHVAPTSAPGTLVAVWREGDGVHAATIGPTGAVSAAGLVLAPPAGGSIARVTAAPSAVGFDLVVDWDGPMGREVAVRPYDASAAPLAPAERVASICGLGFSEGRVSFVRGTSARHAGWTDPGLGIVLAAF